MAEVMVSGSLAPPPHPEVWVKAPAALQALRARLARSGNLPPRQVDERQQAVLLMIHDTAASVFNTSAEVVANTVNCEGVMGAGLALEFALRHPDLEADYQLRCKAGAVQIGRPYLFPVRRAAGYRAVLNFPTKQHWRFPSRLGWIEQGLAYIASQYRRATPADHLPGPAAPRLRQGRSGVAAGAPPDRTPARLICPDLTVYLCSDTAPAEGTEAVMLAAYAGITTAASCRPSSRARCAAPCSMQPCLRAFASWRPSPVWASRAMPACFSTTTAWVMPPSSACCNGAGVEPKQCTCSLDTPS